MAELLAPHGIEVLGFDLPLWHGEEACLHLMSVISPLADDLALVYSPLLPAAFYQLLKARGITLVEGDAGGVRRQQRPQPQRAADRARARSSRSPASRRPRPRWKPPAARSSDLRGRCAVHRLRGRPDLPDAAGPARATPEHGHRRRSAHLPARSTWRRHRVRHSGRPHGRALSRACRLEDPPRHAAPRAGRRLHGRRLCPRHAAARASPSSSPGRA